MILRVILAVISTVMAENALKYPNEIIETPIVLCEPERIVIKIRTTSSNPSHIYAEDFEEDADCSSRNMNKVSLRHGECGMISEKTDSPTGFIHRVCIAVQLHPLFVTEADRSYCAQCVYVTSHVLDDFEQTLDVSEAAPTELLPQFDLQQDVPQCSYSIRKDSPMGPEVHYATIGEKVFHVWQCTGQNAGILVQNCHVEDGQGNKILIIDQNGCGVDHYVMATPDYSEDLMTAYQETHVFKFAQKTVTRFICQIRICIQGEECQHMAPPKSCPTLNERLERAQHMKLAPPTETKEIFKASSRSTEEIIGNDLGVDEAPSPPGYGPIPPITSNTTYGSIYEGSSSKISRTARELTFRKPRNALITGDKNVARVDLVGELRVLDSEEEVQYFENRSTSSACLSQVTYTSLLALLCLFILLSVGLSVAILLLRRSSRKNQTVQIGH